MLACKETALGNIHISKEVFTKISRQIAEGCYGVVGMAQSGKGDGLARLLKGDLAAKGISVAINADKVNITMHIMVEYGINIRAICQSIISNVKFQVKNLTGFTVDNVIVNVAAVRH